MRNQPGKRRKLMKKLIMSLVLVLALSISACVEIDPNQVERLELEGLTLPKGIIPGDVISLEGVKLNVFYIDNDTDTPDETFPLDNEDINLTGTGFVSNYTLNTNSDGDYTLKVSYGGVSLTIRYTVLAYDLLVGPGEDHETIGSALGAAVDGNVIVVREGVYNEKVEISIPNITLKALGETIINNLHDSRGDTGISITATNLGVITVDGFYVYGFKSGIVQSYSKSEGTAFKVHNNTIGPTMDDVMRNGIQVAGSGSEMIGNTVYVAPLDADWSGSGLTISGGTVSDVLVEGNTVIYDPENPKSVAAIGIAPVNGDVNGLIIRNNTMLYSKFGIMFGSYNKDISNVTIEDNTYVSGHSESIGDYYYFAASSYASGNNIKFSNNTISFHPSATADYLYYFMQWFSNLTGSYFDDYPLEDKEYIQISRESGDIRTRDYS
jgi:hypothetical protein